MRLIVRALADLDGEARPPRPDGVVSLLAPDQTPPALPWATPRLVLGFNDIAEPREGLIAPDAAAIERLLGFAGGFPDEATLLLHCWMGISRSPAAAFILACWRAPGIPELRLALALREAAPWATPNPLMGRLADDRLDRKGRMVAALAHIGRGRESARGAPFELDTARLAREAA